MACLGVSVHSLRLSRAEDGTDCLHARRGPMAGGEERDDGSAPLFGRPWPTRGGGRASRFSRGHADGRPAVSVQLCPFWGLVLID